MTSIYSKITVKFIDPVTSTLTKKTMSRVQFLRTISAIARQESDEEIQAFFDAFRI